MAIEDRKALLEDIILTANTFSVELEQAIKRLQENIDFIDQFRILAFGLTLVEMSHKLNTSLESLP